MNSFSNVLKSASLDCQPTAPGYILVAGPKGNIGITKGNAFEIKIIACHYIKEIETAVAVKDNLPVSDRLYRNGLFGGPALG